MKRDSRWIKRWSVPAFANAIAAIAALTKVYAKRIFLFLLLPWVVKKGGLFSTFIIIEDFVYFYIQLDFILVDT